MSRTAVDKLGKRLAATDTAADEDLDMLLELLSAYQEALDVTQARLRALGYQPTSRTKTTGVLIDKLRREHSGLKSVQDIAGTRIICEDRDEQDEIVAEVVRAFADGAREPKVKDRRVEPTHGYRAVHVVVTVLDLPVEIQIRTERQDRWAQIVESMGDRWGRQIRYGQPPPDPERPITPGSDIARGELWESVQALADLTDALEEWQQAVSEVDRLRQEIAEQMGVAESDLTEDDKTLNVKERLAGAESRLNRHLAMFSSVVETLD